MRPNLAAGFSLIELMITIAIFAILVLLAGPLYTEFTGNTQIRTAAESVLAGIRTAQAAAVKQNGPVSFVLAPATGWQVVSLDTEALTDESPPVAEYSLTQGAPRAMVTPSPADAVRLTFNGLGRVQDNPDGTPRLTCAKVTTTTFPNPHQLNVSASVTSGVKMCDPSPNFAPPDPIACPADCN